MRIEGNGGTVLQALRRQGLLPESPCNGKGLCGKCRFRILEGAVPAPTPRERELLTEEELRAGVRLACLSVPEGPVELDPLDLLRERRSKVLGGGELPPFRFSPAVTGERVRLERENRPYGSALCAMVPGLTENPPLGAMKKLPGLLGEKELLAVRYRGELLDLRREGPLCGLAVDIGTTTVAVSLLDLGTGEVLGEDGFLNPQKAYGLDVLSRIHYETEHPEGAAALQRAIVEGLSSSARKLLQGVGVSEDAVYEVTVGGNSTMLHALLGLPLGTLGRAPYHSVFTCAVTARAADLGLLLNPETRVYCIPSVSTYIGGDIVSGALAVRLDEAEDTALFLDIGTNGEMILIHEGRMFSCSCAAGPALEGMNISCGMRAENGAVEHVRLLEDRAELDVIGGGAARGLCGSGLLEAVSQGVRRGLIAKTGRIQKDTPLTDTDQAGKRRLVLGGGVYLTQEDIRQVQLCKGAILSGIVTLLEETGIAPEEVDRVLVAGQFGKHLNPESLTGAGLIPKSLEGRISYVGNASQTGARLCLLSTEERGRAERIAREIAYVELSVSPGYEKRFTKALQFGGE